MDAVLREVAEASATGRVAELYADIRRVLGVPFVVLVYRVLANEPELLEQVWSDLAPNLAGDYGRAAAAELGVAEPRELDPVPAALVRSLDPAATAATLRGFRRANSANLLGLTALLDGVAGPAAAGAVPGFPSPLDAALPMADLGGLAPETAELLERMSVPVAGAERPVLVPSLFRCFAYDHELLAALWERLRPELEGPDLTATVDAAGQRARELAAGFPYRVRRLEDVATRETVARFVRTLPGMIVAGALLEQALRPLFAQDDTDLRATLPPPDRKEASLSSQALLTHYVRQVADVDPLALDLDPWPLPTGEWGVTIEGEDVEYAGRFLYLSEDKRVAVGIERLGPSRLTGTHIGETLYFLAGKVTCRPRGAEPYTLQAGDFCFFPAGVDDVWDIEETYVKLFVIHSEQPLPF